MESSENVENHDKSEDDQPADEDLLSGGVIFEAAAEQDGIAVEIPIATHLRPGRIDA
jgi:catalase (peroxidase I)